MHEQQLSTCKQRFHEVARNFSKVTDRRKNIFCSAPVSEAGTRVSAPTIQSLVQIVLTKWLCFRFFTAAAVAAAAADGLLPARRAVGASPRPASRAAAPGPARLSAAARGDMPPFGLRVGGGVVAASADGRRPRPTHSPTSRLRTGRR